MTLFTVKNIFTGTAQDLEGDLRSGIRRDPARQSIHVGTDKITDNEVVNLKYHGGPDRVVHQYPQENYQILSEKFDQALFRPGSIGENISTVGCVEKQVRIGDIISLGGCVLQVSEPRIPCITIDINYGVNGILKQVIDRGASGWFYRVLQEGSIEVGSEATIEEKGPTHFTLDRVLQLGLKQIDDAALAKDLLDHPALSVRWRKYLKKYQ